MTREWCFRDDGAHFYYCPAKDDPLYASRNAWTSVMDLPAPPETRGRAPRRRPAWDSPLGRGADGNVRRRVDVYAGAATVAAYGSVGELSAGGGERRG